MIPTIHLLPLSNITSFVIIMAELENQIIASFLRFMNRVRSDRMETWSPRFKDVSKVELHILLWVQQNPGTNIGVIKERLGLPSSTLTSIINRMEKKKLLRRTIGDDRRTYRLEILEEGLRIREEHDRILRTIADAIMSNLTPEEQVTFTNLLDKASDSLPVMGTVEDIQ